ncbi:hypothetical protein [Chitinimonas sp. JJ19]|uniref:hypothetical protein n=1 Tax=Chitinimonas sp. JJ19 TaxID=3109352 RepID=UPI001A4A421E|nr:HNH endonuclease [Chitinimonas sp.]
MAKQPVQRGTVVARGLPATHCALCGRLLPEGTTVDEHHLIPRSLGGRETVRLHKICHQTLHAVFTERELAEHFHTVERLQAHATIASFLAWVRRRPPELYDRPRFTQDRRRR